MLSDGGTPAQSVGLWVPDASLTGRSAVAWLGRSLPGQRVSVFAAPDVVDDFDGADDILGGSLQLEPVALTDPGHGLLGGLSIALTHHPVDLLAVAVPPSGVVAPMLAALRGLEVDLLLVPRAAAFDSLPGRLESYDAVVVDGRVRVRLLRALGSLAWTPEDRRLFPVRGGSAGGPVDCVGGMLDLPPDTRGWVGLCSDPNEPVASLEAQVEVLVPEGLPIALVPTVLSPELRARLDGHRLWVVAVDALNPELLRDTEDIHAVLDPDAILDRGDASDVPEAAASCTVDRVRRLLLMAGYPVAAVVWPNDGRLERFEPVSGRGGSLGDRLVDRCGAVPTRVDAAGLQLDNRLARTRLIELLDSATREIDLQVYIYEVDGVGAEVRDALVRAARRGVRVRVLVDALWSGHGTLSRQNPHLSAVESEAGAEVRTCRPLEQLTSLKARNHRKLVVVDQQVLVLAGRNIGDHYYLSFSEVQLGPGSDQRAVPWFDLSVELRGPVVGQARDSFDREWAQAAGERVDNAPARVVKHNAWWVEHDALRDARGLDTLREVFQSAVHEVVLVNTFALAHELRHALLACLGRGVSVRIYTGHVRPRYFGGATPFQGSPERDLATGVVHGRFDPLVAAGAQAWALGVRESGWDASLGLVLPHVHSKLVVVDRRLTVLGSHNLDIASCYWESELMLVLEDGATAGRLLDWLQVQQDTAVAFHAEVPAWRQSTRQPDWVSRNWPSLLT